MRIMVMIGLNYVNILYCLPLIITIVNFHIILTFCC